MSSTGGLCCFICLLPSIIRHVNGVIINGPLNAVVEVGQQATFNCTSNILLQNWVLTTKREDVGADQAEGIAINCVVQAGFTTHYETDRPGGNTSICNLIVKDTTMQQAGIYTCTDIAYGPSAILTVIENSPVITYNNLTVEKENVTIECSLNYTGSMPPAPTLRPYFYWRNSSVQNISSSYDSTTENKAVSRVMVTAARENITPYTCHVYLQLLPPRNAGYANNTPFVSGIASSTTIEVFYEPSTPNISQQIKNFTANDGSICTLTTLTCTSTANPPPNYTWKDVTNGGALMIGVSGSVFELAEDNRTYECIAINNISNLNKSSSATSTVGISSSRPCVSVKSNDIRICSDDGLCDNGATSRSCSNGSHIYLTSNVSNVYPRPTQFQWKDGSGNVLSDTFANNATINGDYNVLVYNEINQQSNTPAVAMVQVTDCLSTMPPTTVTKASTTQSMSKTTETIVIAVVVSGWVLLNLIAMSSFLIYYNGTDPNGRHEHKKILNNYFPWLKNMLSCFNKYSNGGCGRCLWVFLFLLVSLTFGFIVFPILLIRANCTCCSKDAKTQSSSREVHIEFSEINGREAVTNHDGMTRDQSLPSDVRGGLPVPYEECRITTSPPSKPHRSKNKETKQNEKSTIPNYAKVDKTNGRNPNQENDPYSVVRNPDDINVTHNTSAPLPPHQIPARNPIVTLYGHVNLASPSNLRKPVQLITDSDTNYADLRNA